MNSFKSTRPARLRAAALFTALIMLVSLSPARVRAEETEADMVDPGSSASYNNPVKNSDGTVTWDCVWFGSYWQYDTNGDHKADTLDSMEPIKWRVLSADSKELLLLSDKILDTGAFNTSYTGIPWSRSTIRSRLNGLDASSNTYGTDYTFGSFIDSAFNSEERAEINISYIVNDGDQGKYGTDGGGTTLDSLFLLSYKDTLNTNYGFSGNALADRTRMAKATDFAIANGAEAHRTGTSYDGEASWWLRSPGSRSNRAICETFAGEDESKDIDTRTIGIRPALYISPASSLISPAGTVCSDGRVYEKEPEHAARYTVHFNTNGGSAIPAQTVADGESLTAPSIPSREGYIFLGWYRDSSLKTPWDFSEGVTGNLTLYARWRSESTKIVSVGHKLRLPTGKKVAKADVSDRFIASVKVKGKKVIVKGLSKGTVTVIAYDKKGRNLGTWVVEVE